MGIGRIVMKTSHCQSYYSTSFRSCSFTPPCPHSITLKITGTYSFCSKLLAYQPKKKARSPLPKYCFLEKRVLLFWGSYEQIWRIWLWGVTLGTKWQIQFCKKILSYEIDLKKIAILFGLHAQCTVRHPSKHETLVSDAQHRNVWIGSSWLP
jgi:hypothetical protein